MEHEHHELEDETKQAERPAVNLEMLYVTHDEGHVEEVLPYLKEADIVAIEFITHTPEQRAQLQRDANAVTHNETGSEDALSKEDAFLRGVVEGLRGSEKEIRLVDVDATNSDVQALEYESRIEGAIDKIAAAKTLEDYLDGVDDKARADSELDRLREGIVVGQLGGLVDEQTKAAKIVAVMGAFHTGITKELQADPHPNVRLSREFAANHIANDRVTYPVQLEPVRHYRFKPDRPVDRRLLLQAAAAPILASGLRPGDDEYQWSPELQEIVRGLDPNYLDELMQSYVGLSHDASHSGYEPPAEQDREEWREAMLDDARTTVERADGLNDELR